MNIVFYCQHVLGIGHFFRSLEILKALKGHRVTLVTGGPDAGIALPEFVHEVRLPELHMGVNFGELQTSGDKSLDDIWQERTALLLDILRQEQPDIFLVELFPFGRKKFRPELLPALEYLRPLPTKSVCSLRDILVERDDGGKHERRALKILNELFDALLIHSDEQLLPLSETYGLYHAIEVPIHYTGFVAGIPETGARSVIRRELRLDENEKLIVASAGGGKVGGEVLVAAAKACPAILKQVHGRMQIFTGPYCPDETFEFLAQQADSHPNLSVRRFTDKFPDWLAAADLSISQGGYNTTMNLLAAGVPALVSPFAQNREQAMRAERLSGRSAIVPLSPDELTPQTLASKALHMLGMSRYPLQVNLSGASRTAGILCDLNS